MPQINKLPIDAVVREAFFEALRPAQLDALDAVLQAQAADQARVDRHWHEQLKRARYDAHLAQRQYEAVDPENRLVAAELERRWEDALRTVRTVEEDYARFQHQPPVPRLTPAQRQQFQQLSETLPALWQSGAVAVAQQKELLRCLISQVILKRLAAEQVEVRIVWISGHFTILQARTPIWRGQDSTIREQLVARIEQLWQHGTDSDADMAAVLTAEGYYSARSSGVSASAVQKIRLAYGWQYGIYQGRHAAYGQGYVPVDDLAVQIGVERTWILKRIYTGEIAPTEVKRLPHSKVWLIKEEPALVARLHQQMAAHHNA